MEASVRVRHPWESAWRRAATLVLIASILAVACAPTAPAPTAAPAKPAETTKPAEAAKPAEAPKPAAAATTAPAAAPAKPAAGAVQAKGSITMVIEAEPDTIQPKDATTDNAFFVLANVYDGLTARDWTSGEPKIVPKLAESYSQQPDPRTWRFKLRSGLKFHNGEPINADAVVNMVKGVSDPNAPGQGIDEFGLSGATATKIDDLTVDITTKAPDAIFPSRMVKMGIPAPQWLNSSPKDAAITEAIGSGPYKLAEYVKASHFLLKANEEYWSTPKPTIGEVKIVFRNEAVVRAGMIQAGEVQLATLLTLEEAKKLPAHLVELTGESVGIRINTEHPILKDLRVRQAINMSIDRKGIIDALYGEVAEPLNGMMVRKSSLGWNPELKEYPYDPAKAKQLIQEAGATGQTIELISRNGVFPRVGEVNELVADQISQTGLKVNIKSLEAGQWRTILRQVKPGEARADLQLTAVSDPVLDSSRALNNYYVCGAVSAHWCDQEWTAKFTNVLGLSGDARVKGFQELWAIAYDQNVFIPLFGLNFIHGLSPKLKWGPVRQDLIRAFNEWTLTD
jgi:peptide/nickel transport system substrate-binding protein